MTLAIRDASRSRRSPRWSWAGTRATSPTRTTTARSSRRCAGPTARGLPVLILGGGSNVVIADRGWDGLVVRIATRGRRFEERRRRGDADRRGRRAVGRRRRRGRRARSAPGSSACPASPAWSARRRSRTSAPTARRSPTPSDRCSVLERASGRVLELPADGVRVRLPRQRLQARARLPRRARGDVRAAARRRAHAALSRARRRARRRRRSRRWPTSAPTVLALRRKKSMVIVAGDPEPAQRRLVLHEPDRARRRGGRGGRARGRPGRDRDRRTRCRAGRRPAARSSCRPAG